MVPRQFSGGKIVFPTNGTGTTVFPHEKRIKLNTYLKSRTKINSKYVKVLDISITIKLLGDVLSVNFHNLE